MQIIMWPWIENSLEFRKIKKKIVIKTIMTLF